MLQKIAKEKKLKILSYGTNGNTIKIISVKVINSLTQLKINVSGKIYILKLQLIGNFQIENFLSAILACFSCGIAFEKIFSISYKITNPPGRMQFIKQEKKHIIIDYAHTPDALQKTILEIKSFFKRKVNLVFGCGGNRDRVKRKAMGKIAQKLCNKIYITDDNPRYEDQKKLGTKSRQHAQADLLLPLGI